MRARNTTWTISLLTFVSTLGASSESGPWREFLPRNTRRWWSAHNALCFSSASVFCLVLRNHDQQQSTRCKRVIRGARDRVPPRRQLNPRPARSLLIVRPSVEAVINTMLHKLIPRRHWWLSDASTAVYRFTSDRVRSAQKSFVVEAPSCAKKQKGPPELVRWVFFFFFNYITYICNHDSFEKVTSSSELRSEYLVGSFRQRLLIPKGLNLRIPDKGLFQWISLQCIHAHERKWPQQVSKNWSKGSVKCDDEFVKNL